MLFPAGFNVNLLMVLCFSAGFGPLAVLPGYWHDHVSHHFTTQCTARASVYPIIGMMNDTALPGDGVTDGTLPDS